MPSMGTSFKSSMKNRMGGSSLRTTFLGQTGVAAPGTQTEYVLGKMKTVLSEPAQPEVTYNGETPVPSVSADQFQETVKPAGTGMHPLMKVALGVGAVVGTIWVAGKFVKK